MNLSPILTTIQNLSSFQLTRNAIEGNSNGLISIPSLRAARLPLVIALAEATSKPVIMVVGRPDRMRSLMDDVQSWNPQISVYPFPNPNPLFYEQSPWGPRTLRERLQALTFLQIYSEHPDSEGHSHPPNIILTTAHGLCTRTISRETFKNSFIQLRTQWETDFIELINRLVRNGYETSSIVAEPGQISRRGGILDVWSSHSDTPARIEFFGDQIESIRAFNPTDQRSYEILEDVLISPAREGIDIHYQQWSDILQEEITADGQNLDDYLEYFLPWVNPGSNGLLDFLPEDTMLLLDDLSSIEQVMNELEEQAIDTRQEMIEQAIIPSSAPLPYVTMDEILDKFEEFSAVDLGLTGSSAREVPIEAGIGFQPGPKFGGQLESILGYIQSRLYENQSVISVSRQAPRLAELWSRSNDVIQVQDILPEGIAPGELYFIHGALSEGWDLREPDAHGLHLLTDAEIFGFLRPQARIRPFKITPTPESAYADLKSGDFVVHTDYGIGRYQGLVERTLDDIRREFLMIAYAENDQLFVPIHQTDRITRYVSSDSSQPDLSRLGTQEWFRTKEKAIDAAADIAKDLLELYARRMSVRGYAFAPDHSWQHELEASFPYVETDDQIRALDAVKRDLERPRPMDRLICGDVGYGKTEVALRAAFKVVMEGKQVAMLVPTTVLAQQHFHTFQDRLIAFPVEIEMLSRFRTIADAQRILKRLSTGEIDLVIGTHRLLQPDVEFRDLGLLIIDEEQRFGVTHKEYLKHIRTEVDVLTLTATPIPRTLYMALTGVRDISTINTPPEERLPVITHVGPYEAGLIRQAVLRELDRGGQVFFVHNRVQTIESIAERLKTIIPEAQIAIGHGQMPESELSKVMQDFNEGKINVLVSTSIIESGLDIPNANTLIVDRADQFGLAQLYQLRGRVGRGTARGYAYFFHPSRGKTTEDALRRLEVIAEQSYLGAGYSIAMQDLELRGAGDLLGKKQHGHIAAIGFHLYTQLLSSSVKRLRAVSDDEDLPTIDFPEMHEPLAVSIDLPLPSAIPEEYIPDRDLRLQIYRRLAGLRTLDEVDGIIEEMDDRFGTPPSELENLIYQIRTKILASQARVESISSENGQILIRLPTESLKKEFALTNQGVRISKRGIWLRKDTHEGWQFQLLQILKDLSGEVRTPEG